MYQKAQELQRNINIVTVFEYVRDWFNAGQHRGFHCNAPRNMDSTIIVYSNKFDAELLDQVATNCIGKITQPLSSPAVEPIKTNRRTSLLSVVVGRLPNDRKVEATKILVNDFVQSKAMERWHEVTCFLVRHHRTREIEDVMTVVDVGNHPIISMLQDWLHKRTMEDCLVAPPVWPCADKLPNYNWPANAGLGPLDADEAYNAVVHRDAAVSAFLHTHRGRYYHGVQQCGDLLRAVHPHQTCF